MRTFLGRHTESHAMERLEMWIMSELKLVEVSSRLSLAHSVKTHEENQTRAELLFTDSYECNMMQHVSKMLLVSISIIANKTLFDKRQLIHVRIRHKKINIRVAVYS